MAQEEGKPEVLLHPTGAGWSFLLQRSPGEVAGEALYEAYLYHQGSLKQEEPYLRLLWSGEEVVVVEGLRALASCLLETAEEKRFFSDALWMFLPLAGVERPPLRVTPQEVEAFWGPNALTVPYSPLTRLLLPVIMGSEWAVQNLLQGLPATSYGRPFLAPERLEAYLTTVSPWKPVVGASLDRLLVPHYLPLDPIEVLGTEETQRAVREVSLLQQLTSLRHRDHEKALIASVMDDALIAHYSGHSARPEEACHLPLTSLPWHPLQRPEGVSLRELFEDLPWAEVLEFFKGRLNFVLEPGGPTTYENLQWLLKRQPFTNLESLTVVREWQGPTSSGVPIFWRYCEGFVAFLQELLPHRQEFTEAEREALLSLGIPRSRIVKPLPFHPALAAQSSWQEFQEEMGALPLARLLLEATKYAPVTPVHLWCYKAHPEWQRLPLSWTWPLVAAEVVTRPLSLAPRTL